MNQQPKPVLTLADLLTTDKAVLSVWPETGQLLDRKKSAIYSAAKRGDIPTCRINGRLAVPTIALRRWLGIDDLPPPGHEATPAGTGVVSPSQAAGEHGGQ